MSTIHFYLAFVFEADKHLVNLRFALNWKESSWYQKENADRFWQLFFGKS